ncbi:MAG: hypothetical protein NWE83_08215 [Candidatus Bathyarchaeota archaeon]|nr:hypothetical protein [Candidatus Bathyarchaeota archaeon]
MSEESSSGQNNEQLSRTLKTLIISSARNGTLDRNPLLNTAHANTCPHCHHSQRIVYLDALKNGDFDVGQTKQIEVLDSSGPMGVWEKEQVTPVTISYRCDVCSGIVEVSPVTVEYLQLIISKPPVSSAMYS